MADSVRSDIIFEGSRRLVVQLTSLSDGTGETDAIKVDKSSLVGPNGLEPSHLVVEKIQYDVTNMRVNLEWDYGTDVPIAVLQGAGIFDWKEQGGFLVKGSGGTGDIVLTTAGHAANEGYTITLHLRKKD